MFRNEQPFPLVYLILSSLLPLANSISEQTTIQLPVSQQLNMRGNDDENIQRKVRSVSADAFMKLQGNWQFSKQEIEKMFDEYYSCVTKANSEESRMKNPITAILALEGQRVRLVCPTCRRPDQNLEQARLFWQRVRTSDASIGYIRSGKEGITIKKDMSLVIKRIDVKDAGQYFCVKGEDAEIIYQVDVLFKEPQRTVSENDTKALLPAQRLIEHNLKVYTHWSEWGECDQCNKNGRRLKFGTCMVQKIDKNNPIKPVDIPIINLYPDGVPCRSTVLVPQVARLPGIGTRKSEVIEDLELLHLQGWCYQSCPTTPPPIEVTDKNGNVVQVIFAEYHPINQKPELPPMVQRKVMYENSGTDLTLLCPTSDTGKVRWQRGERAINSATIRQQTNGRVSIDRLNRLQIRKLTVRDSATYNCWVWQRHVASMKIIVYKPLDENIKHYITYGGLLITVISLPLCCIYKLCCGKRKRLSRR